MSSSTSSSSSSSSPYNPQYGAVVSMDICAATAGVAFSYSHTPHRIFSVLETRGQPFKIPACVLMDRANSKPLCFGQHAVDQYHNSDPDAPPPGIFYEEFTTQMSRANKILSQRPEVFSFVA